MFFDPAIDREMRRWGDGKETGPCSFFGVNVESWKAGAGEPRCPGPGSRFPVFPVFLIPSPSSRCLLSGPPHFGFGPTAPNGDIDSPSLASAPPSFDRHRVRDASRPGAASRRAHDLGLFLQHARSVRPALALPPAIHGAPRVARDGGLRAPSLPRRGPRGHLCPLQRMGGPTRYAGRRSARPRNQPSARPGAPRQRAHEQPRPGRASAHHRERKTGARRPARNRPALARAARTRPLA